ncbi:MAG: sulfatase [bacterium]|nr:sulfatase [bacterium]
MSLSPSAGPRAPRAACCALAVFVAVMGGACASEEPDAQALAPPTIVLIVADTLRADYLGYSGLGSGVTPAIDRLARESVRFAQVYAAAPWTKPSVASLLTGVGPTRHGVTDHEGHFWSGEEGGDAQRTTGIVPSELLTLAEGLRNAGYRTAGFVANEWLARGYGYEQGFDHYVDDIPPDRPGAAFARADQWLAQQDSDPPLFVYIHTMEVHGPYDATAPFVEQARRAKLGTSHALSDAEFEAIPEYLRTSPWARGPEARDLLEWRTRYAAGVTVLDRALGVFLGRLQESGRSENTAIVFTSDHGEEFLEHGGFDHGRTLFDEQTRVPLLVKFPDVAARDVSAVVSLLSLYPTLLESAGATRADFEASSSPSLWPMILDEAPKSPHLARASATKWQPGLHAMRIEQHKVIVDTDTGAGVLYDLASDPAEQHSVASTEPEMAQSLAGRLFEQIEADRSHAHLPKAAPLDPQTVEALARLGYVDPR